MTGTDSTAVPTPASPFSRRTTCGVPYWFPGSRLRHHAYQTINSTCPCRCSRWCRRQEEGCRRDRQLAEVGTRRPHCRQAPPRGRTQAPTNGRRCVQTLRQDLQLPPATPATLFPETRSMDAVPCYTQICHRVLHVLRPTCPSSPQQNRSYYPCGPVIGGLGQEAHFNH